MKTINVMLLLLLGSWCQAQVGKPSTETSKMDVILGEWTAINQTIRQDGSGQYDLDSALYFEVYKTLGGHGHQVDWYSTADEYLGSTLRAYSSTENAWLSSWFDPQKGIWMDDVKFVYEDEKLILRAKMQDDTGEYEVKRTHEFSDNGEVYNYHHYRKYKGMSQWFLIDRFEARRVK